MPDTGGLVISRPTPIRVRPGDSVGLTLMSDLHVGAPQTDYGLIRRELDAAAEFGDRVLLNGDVFDAILTKDARRFEPDVLHPRLRGRKDILNAAVEWAAELLAPYAYLINVIGCGNHETAVERHHSVDLIRLLIDRLPHPVNHGGYCGFVDYRFRGPGVRHGRRFVLAYHHGPRGMSAERALGRWHSSVEADCVWIGDKHHRTTSHPQRIGCPRAGYQPIIRDVRLVSTGAYLDTFRGQTQSDMRRHGRRSNYAADAGLAPRGKGGARVLVTFDQPDMGYTVRVTQ